MGILQMLDTTSSDTQALVLSPTRELAEQTQKVRRWCPRSVEKDKSQSTIRIVLIYFQRKSVDMSTVFLLKASTSRMGYSL